MLEESAWLLLLDHQLLEFLPAEDVVVSPVERWDDDVLEWFCVKGLILEVLFFQPGRLDLVL